MPEEGVMRFQLCCVILSLLLFLSTGFAAWNQLPTLPYSVLVYGQLTVRAKAGTHPPDSFLVTLRYFGGESSQRVQNLGTYRFSIPNRSIDNEFIVSAGDRVLLRYGFTIDSRVLEEKPVNLLVEWKDESSRTMNRLQTVSIEDFYSRNSANTALMNQAWDAVSKRNNREAVRLLKKVVSADAGDFEAWSELGTVLFSQGEFIDAGKALERALELRPFYPLALLNYGKIQYARKDFDASIRIFIRMLGAYPEVAEAHRYLGEAYGRINDISRAAPELLKAISLDPQGQAEAHVSLASLYDAAGRKDEAAAEYEKFLVLKPDFPAKNKLRQYIIKNKKNQFH